MRFLEIMNGLNTWFSTEEIKILKKLQEADLFGENLSERDQEVLNQLIIRDAVIPFTKNKSLGYRVSKKIKEMKL